MSTGTLLCVCVEGEWVTWFSPLDVSLLLWPHCAAVLLHFGPDVHSLAFLIALVCNLKMFHATAPFHAFNSPTTKWVTDSERVCEANDRSSSSCHLRGRDWRHSSAGEASWLASGRKVAATPVCLLEEISCIALGCTRANKKWNFTTA